MKELPVRFPWIDEFVIGSVISNILSMDIYLRNKQ